MVRTSIGFATRADATPYLKAQQLVLCNLNHALWNSDGKEFDSHRSFIHKIIKASELSSKHVRIKVLNLNL